MVEKNYHKISNERYKKVLNKHDPFDRLIMELAQNGKLDVCVVEIGEESLISGMHDYSRKLLPHQGKHTS